MSGGLGVLAVHFCRSDDEPTCLTSFFVRSLVKQLASSPLIPAYKDFLEADELLRRRLSDESYESAEVLLRDAVTRPLEELKAKGKITLLQRG